jgi:hypothetical protein
MWRYFFLFIHSAQQKLMLEKLETASIPFGAKYP